MTSEQYCLIEGALWQHWLLFLILK